MGSDGYAFFDTPIGRCALVWGPAGIRRVYLPELNETPIRTHIKRNYPRAQETWAHPEIASAITRMTALLRGDSDDLVSIRLDMAGILNFNRCVYDVARHVPPGAVATYGEIAERVGEPEAAQAVGQALGRNPFPIIVPCHRILAADGKAGGFTAPGGVATKVRMLEIEGARRGGAPTLFDEADPRWRGPTTESGADQRNSSE